MENVYDVLQHRGFIQQVTDPEPLRELLASHRVTFYVGFDPTAESLHAGSLLPIMAMANLQRHGHKPIVVIGGGTAMVGDPSGKTEMRKMMSRERIDSNAREMRLQLARYLDLSEGNAIVVNNYDWLGNLNYIEFLRDIGVHFSVNKMLTFEAYKKRMETGLSFLEFNYQLLQAFDFLVLNRDYDCRLQMGGDDQWANILAGTDLIRRMERKDVYGLTKNSKFSKDFGLTNQIQRSAVSIMSNIAEGFERKSNMEFVRFLFIAKGSCAEVRAQLTAALDQEYINNTVYDRRYDDCKKISAMTSSLIKYLSKSIKQ